MFMTFESIRAYMSVPLARPPGRRGAWARFAPEICAAAVYGVGLAALVFRAYRRGSLFDLDGNDLMCGVVAAYWAAAMLLVVLPLGASLSAWHREHALGTTEALLLTPGWHLLLARGRYWHTAWPWVRLMLWLAPLYLVLAGHPLLKEAHHWSGTDAALACVFAGGSKGILSWGLSLVWFRSRPMLDLSAFHLFLVVIRWACDLGSVLVLVAIGCHASARIRSPGGFLTACILVPLFMATALCPQDWLAGILIFAHEALHLRVSEDVVGWIYAAASVLAWVWTAYVGRLAYRRMAGNIDDYLMGEKPGS